MPTKIRVRAYPVREQDGLIWIYMAAPGQERRSASNRAAQVPVSKTPSRAGPKARPLPAASIMP